MRTPCGLPDHGREIDRYEFSDMDKFELHCARASDTVSTWPRWKQSLLNNSPTREQARALTTGEFYVDPPRPQSIVFEIKDSDRCEAFDKLVQEHYAKRALPPTDYFYNRAMARSQELKDNGNAE